MRATTGALLTCVIAGAHLGCSEGSARDGGDAGGGGQLQSVGGGGKANTVNTGGGTASGGTATGGTASGGTATGGTATGGNATGGNATGGNAGSTAAGGGMGADCKRGIAANTAPGAAFFPAIAWWYNWSMQGAGTAIGMDFAPMVWGSSSLNAIVPGGSNFLLGFNEPNFHAQSNLTAAQAAGHWPMLEAKAANIPLVSPAMNFCGPAANCNGTNPYQYLKDFFATCSGCRVDYVAVHWYNCDLPSLRDYLEPGGNLEGFEQFGKPIWLTEFSCDPTASVAQQEAYMRVAIPYLESNAHVFRYSWFSADPIPNAKVVNADGSPSALGRVYIGLDQACR